MTEKRLTRFFCKIRYDGTQYCGWQKQKNGLSVQAVLEESLSRVLNQPVKLFGSGRTDAGVHALAQTAHFDAKTAMEPARILHGMNALAPSDIQLLKMARVAGDFHARFHAKGKTYRYQILQRRRPDPFEYKYMHFESGPLDIPGMREAAGHFIGEHDFRAFRSSGAKLNQNTVRRITTSLIKQRGNQIIYEVTGNGFLYNMVRAMIGCLLEVGRGRCEPTWIRFLLKEGTRKQGGPTAPAKGLFLVKVEY